MTVQLDMLQTTALAVIVLFLGELIRNKAPILKKYCIPSPVIGGLFFAVLFLVLKQYNILTITFDTTLQTFFMNMFFTTVGFTASLRLLKKSGIPVLVFLTISIVLIFLQNGLGIALAKVFNLNGLLGLATGSIPLVGGIGTSGAFGPLLEKAGAEGATTVAVAAATFGMIMGSIIGNPLAKNLIEKHGLMKNHKTAAFEPGLSAELAVSDEVGEVKAENFYPAFAQILLAMGIGTIISSFFTKVGFTFPPYIGAMFAAAIIRNLADFTGMYKVPEDEIKVVGDISLSIYLAIALMGLKLWQLADLALPLVVMLVAQTILMMLMAYFITFNLMGRDYEAAVLTSGFCGFGMGATSNAMANMRALVEQYAPAPRAFFIVPLVGSLFIDFFNGILIVVFMNMIK
ncbi:sodium/glutamate symporter [Thermosediminibacter oceani]|uniref:Sodium/glutamate symporter n=1 Tax=Thermosediminibacter oceani (strain ATCC BAA-1034 / DSM 16646 / JW/IW-1228P) TaxID=555079 RepID=D9S1G1_THEOJ|nr:sodium/glutamate symporter [Thermosediminibacter oceani]ADL07238.1 sodium/glutamate symporter [Thermosediminibacter oceani DSM 16646]